MILGSYSNAQGGRIYLNLSGNMENRSMFGTVQHEAGHALLTGTTRLGFLQNVLYMEAMAAEEQDRAYSADRRTCARMIGERTKKVQEIYANNMELLALEKELGREEMLRALQYRPREYQDFYMEMMPVHHSGLSIREKMECVHGLCAFAMNLPIRQQALKDSRTLAEFLRGENDPYGRLRRAIDAFAAQESIPQEVVDELSALRLAEEITIYVKPIVRETIANLNSLLEPDARKGAEELFDEQIMKQICLFDLAKVHPKRSGEPMAGDRDVFLVLKNVQNLMCEDHYYLIGYDRSYVSDEVDPAELRRKIETCISGCTTMSEFREAEEIAGAFAAGKKLLTVILQTSGECARWLREEKKLGTVYVGELRAVCEQTDVSILFFCRRGCPQRVYVFPTLHAIRNRLLKELDLEKNCIPADEEAFLKLFSYLNDELEMLKYLNGLLPLLLDRPREEMHKSDVLRQLPLIVERTLANNVLRIKRKDHYKILAALPTLETGDAPLFTLMRFEGTRNTGDTYLDAGAKAPLLFPTKAAAEAFAKRGAAEYTGTGVDKVFWPIFRNMVRGQSGKAILVLDAARGIGKLADIGEIGAVWYR